MQQELGWYFPDGEKHLPEWMRKVAQQRHGILQYQLAKYQAAMKYCRQYRTAVDVGAHVGQWSWNMCKDFKGVFAFEPVPRYAECWLANTKEAHNARLYECALGDEEKIVALTCGTPGSHGDTFIAPESDHNVATDVLMQKLDSFGFTEVDFIKIDCEGYEYFVLRGAEKTIRQNKPCIIVEQKPGKGKSFGLDDRDAVRLLQSWGAKLREEISGDYILSWDVR